MGDIKNHGSQPEIRNINGIMNGIVKDQYRNNWVFKNLLDGIHPWCLLQWQFKIGGITP